MDDLTLAQSHLEACREADVGYTAWGQAKGDAFEPRGADVEAGLSRTGEIAANKLVACRQTGPLTAALVAMSALRTGCIDKGAAI